MSVEDMAPMQITPDGGSETVLPVFDVAVPMGLRNQSILHSGNLYPSTILHAGGAPVLSVSMPAKAALDNIGLTVKKLSDLKVWFATYSDGVRQTGANHTNWQASSGGYAVITDISASDGQVATASVSIWPLAADDLADPWTENNGSTLPTLGSEPTLNTLGPVALSGSRIAGLQSVAVQMNHRATPVRKDGSRYLRDFIYGGGSPIISGQHNTALDIQDNLGFEGTVVTDVDVYLRENDPSNGTLKSTGIELAVSDGYWQMDSVQQAQNQIVGSSWTVICESTDNTSFPIAYTASATVVS